MHCARFLKSFEFDILTCIKSLKRMKNTKKSLNARIVYFSYTTSDGGVLTKLFAKLLT